MTTKQQQQQQHVSRFLEASLLRQAEGKLKNILYSYQEVHEFLELCPQLVTLVTTPSYMKKFEFLTH